MTNVQLACKHDRIFLRARGTLWLRRGGGHLNDVARSPVQPKESCVAQRLPPRVPSRQPSSPREDTTRGPVAVSAGHFPTDPPRSVGSSSLSLRKDSEYTVGLTPSELRREPSSKPGMQTNCIRPPLSDCRILHNDTSFWSPGQPRPPSPVRQSRRRGATLTRMYGATRRSDDACPKSCPEFSAGSCPVHACSKGYGRPRNPARGCIDVFLAAS